MFFFLPWGPKLLQLQNLGGSFVVFFLGGQNRNFGKVRGRKLLLSLKFKDHTLILERKKRSYSPQKCVFVWIEFWHMSYQTPKKTLTD
jgi:hypothetical protein